MTASTDDPAPVFVRVGSHRAGDRLARLLGVDRLDWHYTWSAGACFVLIPADRLDEAREIPGVTRARTHATPRRCPRL